MEQKLARPVPEVRWSLSRWRNRDWPMRLEVGKLERKGWQAGQWPGILPHHGFIQSTTGSCSKVLAHEMAQSPGHFTKICWMGQAY